MSYRDPYNTAPNYNNTNYTDDFNPYTSNHQAHPSYDQGYAGYRDFSTDSPGQNSSAPQRQSTTRSFATGHGRKPSANVPPVTTEKVRDADEASGFDRGEFSAQPEADRDFKSFRRSYQANLWTSGSRVSCLGRFCCCTLLIAVFLIISILLSLALWVRPPAVSIGNVAPTTTGNEIQLKTDGVSINLGINISVNNPNFFTVTFTKIEADLFYPINNTNTAIGGGTANNIHFGSHQITNFTFPFSLDYSISSDPNHAILNDLASICTSSPPGFLTIQYKITVGIRILFIPISPVVSNSLRFQCPLQSSDIDDLLKLAGLLTSGSTRELDTKLLGAD